MWAFANKNKLTAAVLLCVVLGLVLLINFGERNNSAKIQSAVSSMYEDRLVVEGYIFNYSRVLGQIEEIAENPATAPEQKQQEISTRLGEISRLNALYAETRLTTDEASSFNRFTKLCTFMASHNAAGRYETAGILAEQAGDILQRLSAIQMEEARAQMDNVSRISSFSSLMSHFELVVLIIIAILLQALVFSSKLLTAAKYPDKAHLN